MQPSDAFLLFFKGLARHAPGTDESTLRALAACELPPDPVVYDLGAGSGASTLVLAEELGVRVIAVDQLPRSLEELQTRAERRGIAELVETRVADISGLQIAPQSVDLLWSEAAIYAVGWDVGLQRWREHLREGGYLAVSDAVWASSERPAEAVEFWGREYPQMRTAAEREQQAREAGFEVVASFALPDEAWADYYGPLGQRVGLVLGSNPTEEMREIAEAVEEEIAVWEAHGDAVSYTFFVLRRLSG